MAISTDINPRTDPNLAPGQQTLQFFPAILASNTYPPKTLKNTSIHQTSSPLTKLTNILEMLTAMATNMAKLETKVDSQHLVQKAPIFQPQLNPVNTTPSSSLITTPQAQSHVQVAPIANNSQQPPVLDQSHTRTTTLSQIPTHIIYHPSGSLAAFCSPNPPINRHTNGVHPRFIKSAAVSQHVPIQPTSPV